MPAPDLAHPRPLGAEAPAVTLKLANSTPPPEAVPIDGREALLALLDEMREQVEAGEIFALAIAAVGDISQFTAWELSRRGNVTCLLGTVAHLQYRLNDEAFEKAGE